MIVSTIPGFIFVIGLSHDTTAKLITEKYKEKIKQLEDQISKHQTTIDGADAKIQADRAKIESTRTSFEHTHQSILNQIEKDIENINIYL